MFEGRNNLRNSANQSGMSALQLAAMHAHKETVEDGWFGNEWGENYHKWQQGVYPLPVLNGVLYINLKTWPYKWVTLLLGGFFTPFLPLVGTHPDLPLRIQELCRWSADVNYVNKRAVLQCTALHMAIVSQCVDIVRFLQLESIGVFGMLVVVYVEAMVSVHWKLCEMPTRKLHERPMRSTKYWNLWNRSLAYWK